VGERRRWERGQNDFKTVLTVLTRFRFPKERSSSGGMFWIDSAAGSGSRHRTYRRPRQPSSVDCNSTDLPTKRTQSARRWSSASRLDKRGKMANIKFL